MQGSLWRQRTDSTAAEQLTDDRGSDYQPDCSPDGRASCSCATTAASMELMLLDLASRAVRPLTTNGAVNVEPRWSPDGRRLAFVSPPGTGHFLLHVAEFRDGRIAEARPLTPDRRSAVARYYYSPFDHAINPAWTRDGKELLFVSNREIPHGTGDIVRLAVTGAARRAVQHEETSWHARPDVSPDGTESSTAVTSGASGNSSGCCPSRRATRFRSPTATTTIPTRAGLRMAARSRSSPIGPATPRSG
jgi:Tol biopolymer transport system component